MKLAKPFLIFLLAVFSVSPAFAEEGKAVSYSLKKQGRVHFEEKVQDQAAKTDETVNPEDIEPAAGDNDSNFGKPAQENSLAEKLKLPRKN